MVQSVLAGEADVAVALTEGIVAATVNQNAIAGDDKDKQLRYCGQYVTSPLRWMIVTGAGRGLTSLGDIYSILEGGGSASTEDAPPRKIRVSISRLGSGSHLMAYLLATRQGWPTDRLEFTVDRDFRSMRRAVVEGTADIFMWEWFMTKPFVDEGELAVMGFIDTPWPCFGLAAKASWLAAPGNAAALQAVMSVVLAQAAQFLREEDASCEEICAAFGIALEDAKSWMTSVRYASDMTVPTAMLRGVLKILASVGVITLPAAGQQQQEASSEGGGDKPGSPTSPHVSIPTGFVAASIADASVCVLTGPDADTDAPPSGEVAAPAAAEGTPTKERPAAAAAAAAADSGSTEYHYQDEEAPLLTVSPSRIRAPAVASSVSAGSTPLTASATSVTSATDVFTLPTPGSAPRPAGSGAVAVAAAGGRSRSNSLASTGSSNALTAAKAAAVAAAIPDASSPVTPSRAGGPGGFSVSGRSGSAALLTSLSKHPRGEGMWHLKSGDALPLRAHPHEYEAWKGRKAAALADVLRHLEGYGGAVVLDGHPSPVPSVPFKQATALVKEERSSRQRERASTGGSGSRTADYSPVAPSSTASTSAAGNMERDVTARSSANSSSATKGVSFGGADSSASVELTLPADLSALNLSRSADEAESGRASGGAAAAAAAGYLSPSGGIAAVPPANRARRNSRLYAPGPGWDGRSWAYDFG